MRNIILAGALATASLAPSVASAQPGATELPTFTPAYEPRTIDERGLWMDADEHERRLRDSPLVIHDEALTAYIRRVLCTTVGSDRCRSVRIYVLEVPASNAYMTPNGTMVIWSGLLLRTRSEAELGAVLGHEFGHFELRHGLQDFKRRRTTGDVVAWLSVLGGLSGTNTGLTQIALVGSYFRFSREQETQADLIGIKYLGSSPYPATAAPGFWQHLMAESDATALGRKRKPKQRYSAGFFDSHPTDLKRALYLKEAASKSGDSTSSPEAAGHYAAVQKFLPRFLEAQVKLNDFGGTEYLLGQLAATSGWTGDLLYARGELYRTRGNPRDLVSAAQFYGDAIKAGYTAPEVRRGLGLSMLRSGQLVDGKAALNEYLRLKPDASDAKAISALVAN
jgi:peptidase M48-like protein